MMRDKGFDFQWYDKYCDNLFAKHFEKNKNYYDVVTAYEVFEHLPNPVQDVGEMLSYGDNLIFCTSIVPEDVKDISSWWYFMPYHGQHISFYTKKSLSILAAKFGRKYVGYGDMHMFTKKKCSTIKFALSCRFKKIIQRIWKRKSLLMDDYNSIIE